MAVALAVPLGVAGAIAALALAGASISTRTGHGALPRDPVTLARDDAAAWLSRYMAADGRVVRRDQGGDTVSEGQAYAMLLAVAAGRQRDFQLAWQWDAEHLQLANHLSSYHWQRGRVTGVDPASDADLDMAWALVLGAKRFDDPSYGTAGLQIASAILADETIPVRGQLVLTAGPWARVAPFVVDPSYLAPEAMSALAAASGDPRWTQLLTNSVALVASLDTGSAKSVLPKTVLPKTVLPPDWAAVEVTGAVHAIGGPSSSRPPAYGLDAQRVPVWFAAACTARARTVAADAWPTLRSAKDHGGRLSYSLSGVSRSRRDNPLGLVAAAASAAAAGHRSAAAGLLDRAQARSAGYHTYYGDAWVALGRVLLDTSALSPCPPTP